MEHIEIRKSKLLELVENLKKEIPPHYKIYIKVDYKNKNIYLRIDKRPNFEEIKKLESIVKVFFEGYSVKILVD
ncbi:MAG: hypothetical protein QXO12_02815 [Candidatus Pacearchaeota archaeon]